MTAPVGSKANPSKYDPLSKLADDEPYFVIRADDVLSSALVELHAYIGAGQIGRRAQQARRDHVAHLRQAAAPVGLAQVSRDVRNLCGDGKMAQQPVAVTR